MSRDSFQMLQALKIVEETTNCYSFNRYSRTEWLRVILFLMDEGYPKDHIIHILRSKHVRLVGILTWRPTCENFRAYYSEGIGKSYINRMLLSNDSIENYKD